MGAFIEGMNIVMPNYQRTKVSSLDSKEWQAQADANALIEAAAIDSDPARKKKAIAAATAIAEEAQAHANAIKKIARRKVKPVSRKTSIKKRVK
jgi:hypothetical protein